MTQGGADEVRRGGLFQPAFGLGGFALPFRDRFDRVAQHGNLGAGGLELARGVFGPRKAAIAFPAKAGTDGFDGARKQGVVGRVDIREREPGFNGGKLSEHGGGGGGIDGLMDYWIIGLADQWRPAIRGKRIWQND
jgi:hypothetical protein